MAIDALCGDADTPPADSRPVVDFQRPVHCMLGMPIDLLSKKEAIERIRRSAASGLRCWVSTPNVQYLAAVQKDRAFRNALIQGDMSVVDGMPLIWIGRLLGVPIKERVAGSDLFEALSRGEGGPLKVYFFGGQDGVAELACQRLNALAGPVTCVGYASPGFGGIEQMSSPEIIDQINRSGADFVVVALGASKGQAWIERNHDALKVPVISHLGAVINFVAGTVKRAPTWMQHIGLEWLWRIKEEPALWRRYWSDAKLIAPLLGRRVLPGLLHRGVGILTAAGEPAKAGVTDISASSLTANAFAGKREVRLTLSGSWSDADLPLLRASLEALCREPAHVAVDVSSVGRINGPVIALLMLLHAHQRRMGLALKFESPTRQFCRYLKLHCAEFLVAENRA